MNPISTRPLWYNAPTMLPASGQQHRRWIIPQAVTHSLVLLKMGKIIARNMFELTGIINKPLLLHLVGCLYYLYQWCTVKEISDNEIYLLIKYRKSVVWRVAKCLSYMEEARCLKLKSMKNFPVTPSAIDPATSRLVAQCLNIHTFVFCLGLYCTAQDQRSVWFLCTEY